ncbi:hypothetical protein [Candidatus Pelagibacter sp.]|uniref:hypothetical protein n=1 Tax=Candidatus Pelagibacter sp. TaxID=2024849 RepID=UPI003F82DD16
MKKILFKLLTLIIFSVLSVVAYLSLVGVETKKFNSLIITNIEKVDPKLKVNLSDVKIKLNPLKFKIDLKTLGTSISYQSKPVDLEYIKIEISLRNLLDKKISSSKFLISTKAIEVNNLVSFTRSLTGETKLFILENFIQKGIIIADLKLSIGDSGKIKDDFEIKGLVKDANIKLLDNKKISDINFIFNIQKSLASINDLNFKYDKVNLSAESVKIKTNQDEIDISGKLRNQITTLNDQETLDLISFDDFNFKNVRFTSNNEFKLVFNKDLKLKNFRTNSFINIKEASIQNDYDFTNIFPNIKKELNLKNHELNVLNDNSKIIIEGQGEISAQKNLDKIKYKFENIADKFLFDLKLDLISNPINISFLNYKNDSKEDTLIDIKGTYLENKKFNFDKINISSKNNKISLNKLYLNDKFQFSSIQNAVFNFVDTINIRNDFELKKSKKNEYSIVGKSFNSTKIIDELLVGEDIDNFLPDIKLEINIDKVLVDKENDINNLKGKLVFKDNKIENGNLTGLFSDNEKINLTIITKNENTVTTFFSDRAEPFVKRFKFIKGFEEGALDFYSVKSGNSSNSHLKIYDFKLQELPALTKILTLASLQGIADLLSGEGIRFNDFEMNFENRKNSLKINEIYAIGPAISIMMEGYVEKNDIISLRGTLVPATTINKAISSIPLLGNILVGKKTGEGVFGVSFKIKGPPGKTETSVNPIKTLTPRFITRTLEKLKKN